MRWLDGIPDSMDMNLSELQECWCTAKPDILQSMGLKSQTQLSYWTELNWTECIVFFIFYIFKNLFILIGG